MRIRFCLFISALLTLSACGNTLSGAWDDTIGQMNRADWSLFGSPQKLKTEPNNGAQSPILAQNQCPPVYIVPDLNRIVQFQGQSLIAETRFSGLGSSCALNGNNLLVTISLEATGRLGTQGMKDAKIQANYTYPYLLAVVNESGVIVAKDVFALNAVYQNGQNTGVFRDQITQTIPLSNGKNPLTYNIQIGFQLSPEELAYNRQYK